MGIEIDGQRAANALVNSRGMIQRGCAFRHSGKDYDACIGNPPYVRHHDIESPWKEETTARIARDLGVNLDLHGNLYLYFICLGLLKTHQNGLVGMVVPFEWASRPSAAALREFIKKNRWNVCVYRFRERIFQGVLTTASISIIDKSKTDGRWSFYDVDEKLTVHSRKGVSGNSSGILRHAKRGKIWARRGISPGSQAIFTLTEGERIHAGLTRRDVYPCITSMRFLPRSLHELTAAAFEKHLVEGGQRCWLVKSDRPRLSARVSAYLENVPVAKRQTWTCLNQEPWYAFEQAPIPRLLLHSGFTKFGPKVLVNSVRAKAVGSVYSVHAPASISVRALRDYFLRVDFEKRVVAHAKTLKKVEVRQVNGLAVSWLKRRRRQ